MASLTGSVSSGGAVVEVPAIPDRRGGWWHEYVCPTHGTELLPARDQVFPCPHGCELTGEPYAGAWTVLAHQAAARSLRRLAVRARGGDRAAGDAAVAGLAHYAELYGRLADEAHPDAQGWMLSGRLFQQALTEAIWGTSLAHAVHTLAGSVDHERLEPAAALLRALRAGARAARDVLVERDDFRNNYTAWLNAAGSSASRALALLGETDQSAGWLTGEHGIAAHAAASIHPDGWEWEGSSYYHVFVLRGYLLALRGCAPETVPAELLRRLHDMTAVVATLGTDTGGTLPALHDTPYAGPRWDDELYELCLLSAGLPGAPGLVHLAEPLAARLRPDLEGHWRSEEALSWFGATRAAAEVPPPRTRLFPDAGYAVLRGTGYQAVLDFGPHGGSHGHLDKLALYLYGPSAAWQPAYGVPPYAHPLRRDYYTRTAAHPTLTVDGADQREATGRLLYWHDDVAGGFTAVGAEADVYDGVRFERHLRADAEQLIDVVTVEADRERELVLHLRTDVDVQVRRSGAGTHSHWPGDSGLTGWHAAAPVSALTTGADLGPADDPQRSRAHLRWRTVGPRAVFASVYSPGGVASGISIEQTGGDLTIHVQRHRGDPVRWLVPTRRDGVTQ
ncbi:MAG TPA: heparinase II/III family protein [Pseudonocardia sp.]|nr:heparinase II/III family protein [Pseudonocardia sp.]